MKNKGLYKRFVHRVNNIKSPSRRAIFGCGLLFGSLGFYVVEVGVSPFFLQWKLRAENEKALYTLGQFYARRSNSMRFNADESKIVARGFQDWAGLKTAVIDYEAHRPLLQNLIESRNKNQLKIAKQEGKAYIEKFVKSRGFLSISGLAYRVMNPGSLKKPSGKDWVEVSYRGTLIDGTVIDATTDTRPKAKLPMNGIIRGWVEGLQLVGEGGEIDLVIPSELAYGDQATTSGIPPGSTLRFQIQLHRILPSGHVN